MPVLISANPCFTEVTKQVKNKLESKLNNSQVDIGNIELGPVYINQHPTLVNGVSKKTSAIVIALKYSKNNIGHVILEQVSEFNNKLYETHIEIKDVDYKNKGIGPLLYLTAVVLAHSWGFKLVSSASPSDQAKRIHDWFVMYGLSKKVNITINTQNGPISMGMRYQFEYDKIK
ncbi:MAG: hypothetical protein KDD40_08900, partial [Bdellovibrionales bacterium]|nr:hypothetical protein [Bdellovibrionales bacterium]